MPAAVRPARAGRRAVYEYLRPRVLWTAALPEQPVGGVAADGGAAFVALVDGTLRAYDLGSGKERWSSALGDPAQTGPAASGGVVVVATTGRQLKAFAADSGRPVWQATLEAQASSEPVAASGAAAVGVGNQACAAFALADGKVLWRKAALGDVVAAPWLGDRLAVFGSTGHSLYAVAKPSGEGLKEVTLSGEVLGRPGSDSAGTASPVIAVGTHDGRLHVLTGGWQRPWSVALRGIARAAPLVTANSVFAGTDAGLLYALDRFDGGTRWHLGVGGPVVERLALVAGSLIVAAGRTVLYVDPATGEVRESFALAGLARGMAESGGTAAVADDARELLGIGVRISAGEQGPEAKTALASVIAEPAEFSPARGQSGSLSFSLLRDAPLTVDAADALGRRVRLLATRDRALANTYQFEWDGKDDQGRLVRPGVYRLRVVAGDEEVSVGIDVLGTR